MKTKAKEEQEADSMKKRITFMAGLIAAADMLAERL